MRSSSAASRSSSSRSTSMRANGSNARSASGLPRHSAERLAQALGGTLRRARRERAASLLGQVLEALEIELAEADTQEVAGRARDENALVASALPECRAQARDVDLQRVGGARRRPLAPQLVDQRIRRDDLVGAKEEDRKQRALLATAERHLHSVVHSLERAEHPELHRARLERKRPEMRALRGAASSVRASRAHARRRLPAPPVNGTHEEEASHDTANSADSRSSRAGLAACSAMLAAEALATPPGKDGRIAFMRAATPDGENGSIFTLGSRTASSRPA